MSKLALSAFDAVAFDFEGTLADTIPIHQHARLAAFAAHGYGHVTLEQHALGQTYGSYATDIVGGILHAAGEIGTDVPFAENPIVRAIVATRAALYEEAAAVGFEPMPGATLFVRKISPYFKDRTALVTSSEEKYFWPFADRQRIHQLFPQERVIGHGSILAEGLAGKPSADPYLLAMRRLGSAKLLVFEDTPPGVAAAKKAGATVVAVGFDPGSARQFAEGGLAYPPDVFVRDYAEAATVLGLGTMTL
jgi:beta-phosphoglucomutase-like phosphatase (HAD superfamily)